MVDTADPPFTPAEIARAEARLHRAAWRVFKRAGFSDEAIPAEIEKMWRTDPGFVLPSIEDLERDPDLRGSG